MPGLALLPRMLLMRPQPARAEPVQLLVLRQRRCAMYPVLQRLEPQVEAELLVLPSLQAAIQLQDEARLAAAELPQVARARSRLQERLRDRQQTRLSLRLVQMELLLLHMPQLRARALVPQPSGLAELERAGPEAAVDSAAARELPLAAVQGT